MTHVDPETLALLALGEQVASATELAHLEGCEACSVERANLARAATVGRTALDEGELLVPHSRVWSRISADLRLSPDVEPSQPAVTHISARRRPLLISLGVAAAVAVIAGGGLLAWNLLQPAAPSTLATAVLEPFPDWTDSAGEATVEREPDGSRTVEVTFEGPSSGENYREVWLISADTDELVSLGTLSGDTGSFAVPDGLDLTKYDIVDISDEPFDGDPTHSGDSILRGQLQAAT